MKPLQEEEIIDNLFKKLQILGLKIPERVIFYDDYKTMGRANKHCIYICSNHIDKDLMSTVVHEVVHYNGFMHHRESFWNKYREVMDEIKKR